MCIFHKWTKWKQYTEHGIWYGPFWRKDPKGVPYAERRQRRHCEKCGKEQDELVCAS